MTMRPLVDKRMFLGANPLFEGLAPEDLNDLVVTTRHKSVTTGQTVLRQGDPGRDMYIIVSGRVSIRIRLADDEEIAVGELTAGEAFGEIALFDEQPRTASVVTCEPCRFLLIDRDAFKAFLLIHPRVAIQLLAVMSKRLRATDDLLKDALYADVASRLAETLRNIAGAYGKNIRNGLRIDVPFDDRELGRIAGVPSDVVTAQLRHWANAGLISVHRGHLTLIKPAELARATDHHAGSGSSRGTN
ncbi:MAG: putative transcriptional regulator with a cAMP binding domain Crp family [Gammaproteobacteria bacterium]|nr:MAG: putative transcriptional regulator with a cAMP binding domain Crp family [Gammaproteobacteria bacterium]TND01420.1 MAG: putative transcriptional regulator with a cAMP binding domain, Crp family [Gammaproteobacteria bacterium]